MILYSGLTSVIGKPEEYATNKTNGTFPDSYDIRIPTAPRHETVETSAFEDVEIKDLS
jgi:ssDNA-binding replication factor A large subunit